MGVDYKEYRRIAMECAGMLSSRLKKEQVEVPLYYTWYDGIPSLFRV